MNNDYPVICVSAPQTQTTGCLARLVRRCFRAAIAMLVAQLLFAGTSTFGQPAYAIPSTPGSANVYDSVARPEIPVPEPNAALVSIAGGVLLLLVSRKYIRV